MKIAISSNGNELSSVLDPRFGRCSFIAFYDTDAAKWSFVANPGALEGSGAGVKASQFLAEQHVDILITGDLGPKASRILDSAGIKVYSLSEVPLEEALHRYQQGEARLIVEANVSAHHGELAGQNVTPVSRGKIAIATDGSEVAQHFGRCPAYTLVQINGDRIVNTTVIDNPGHEPGFLPRFLGEKEVTCIIAGGMGPKAQNLFAEQGIDTIIGVTGPVERVMQSYLSGSLTGGESLCEHGLHDHEHGCEGH